MDRLQSRIALEGKNLGGGILGVSTLVNHAVDVPFMLECACQLVDHFRDFGATKVLTAEISGIAPAILTGMLLGVPVVYARKTKPITMPEKFFSAAAPSRTKGDVVRLIVSPEVLGPGDLVLIIDDFLASGKTIGALADIVSQAQATLVGIGTLIEKVFEGGRQALQYLGVPIKSLVIIASMDDGRIEFA